MVIDDHFRGRFKPSLIAYDRVATVFQNPDVHPIKDTLTDGDSAGPYHHPPFAAQQHLPTKIS
jgi:hypothetical protein